MKLRGKLKDTDIIIGYTISFDPQDINEQYVGDMKHRMINMAVHNGIIKVDHGDVDWDFANDDASITIEEIKAQFKK
jgi:hypothetical protein